MLSLKEVAARLGVAYATVHAEATSGNLKAIRVRSRWLVAESDLDAYLKAAVHRPAGAVVRTPAKPKPRAERISFPASMPKADQERLREAWRRKGIRVD